MSIPRWTIPELLARYSLEPTLQDIFVEGVFDLEVVSRCLKEVGKRGVVYEIDAVDVPDNVLSVHALTTGNKSRVIALALELASVEGEPCYRCFVDKDLDHWCGSVLSAPRLIATRYTAIELYYFDEEIIKDIVLTTARSKIQNWDEFFASLTCTLRELFLFRLADQQLNLNLQWLSADRCLKVVGNRIAFDSSEYVGRLLLKNGRQKVRADFDKAVELWRGKMSVDDRLCIRGHDFTELLAWVVGKYRGIKAFALDEAIERLLVLLSGRISTPLLEDLA